MQGVILQTYGAGNVPDTRANSYLFDELKEACDRGVIVVNCTQCSSGVVTNMYAGSIVSCPEYHCLSLSCSSCVETEACWSGTWCRHDY